MKRMPREGIDADTILRTLADLRGDDVQWRDGRAFSLVYHAGDDLSSFVKQAYTTYFSENALNPSAFPSLRRMEAEVVSMAADMLGGDENVVGNLTSGGTESILMAVKTAREWGRVHRRALRGGGRPKMVLPASAHPAFDKAAHYFGVRAVRVPVAKDLRACVWRMSRAVDRKTVLVVGSAPSYPHGVVDPIEDLARMAKRKGVLMHVDACIGGFMLPFVRALGRPVPPFDFSVEGVTSMSADVHKFGYAAKGASLVLHRDAEQRKHQYFATTDWSGGLYASPTMTGTRPGGAVAAAWAVMHRLGFEGYVKLAGPVMETTDRIRAGVESIEELEVLGDPTMCILGIASDTLDVYVVADHMQARGWHLDRQQFPATLHLTVNPAHVPVAGQFVDDLRESVRLSAREPADRWKERAKYAALNATLRVLPSRLVSKLTDVASRRMGLGGSDLPQQSAPMYGMMAALPNRGDLRKLVIDALDGMTTYEPGAKIPIDEEPRSS